MLLDSYTNIGFTYGCSVCHSLYIRYAASNESFVHTFLFVIKIILQAALLSFFKNPESSAKDNRWYIKYFRALSDFVHLKQCYYFCNHYKRLFSFFRLETWENPETNDRWDIGVRVGAVRGYFYISKRGKGLLRGGGGITQYTVALKKNIHKNYNHHYIVYVLHIPV